MSKSLDKIKKITAPEAVRVRFAPSPTGYLHIGSARTAFFNWLYAKKSKGKFILRIEDTDISRHIEESIELIISSLKWLGITWDEGPDIGGNYGPYRQSQRKEIYKQYAENLVKQKKAYYCFCSPQKLRDKTHSSKDNHKDKCEDASFYKSINNRVNSLENNRENKHEYKLEDKCEDKREDKYDRECLKLSQMQIEQNINNNIPYAIRFLIPQDKKIIFEDVVYGKIEINSNVLDDFIIIRSNGLPTYNFSAALDDILMEITHVIRGEDHLSNTPKQILIYEALGKSLPVFVHLPMILGQDGQKLSKRHGSIAVETYKEEGFLPEAIKNYMALLGWSYDEKTTIFSTQDLIKKFSLEKINKKPARFDYNKLLWFNGYYIRILKSSSLEKLVYDKFIDLVEDKESFSKNLPRLIPLIKPRIKTINEASKFILPFFTEITYDKDIIYQKIQVSQPNNSYKDNDSEIKPKNEKITKEGLKQDKIKEVNIKILYEAALLLKSLDEFLPEKIEITLKKLAEKLEVNFRVVAEVIRIAVWGSKISPPLFETLSILGKEKSIERLKKYSDFLNNLIKNF